MDRLFRNVPNRCCEIAAGPECRKPGAERGELFTKDPARPPFQAIDDFGNTERRIGFNKDVNVIWPDVQRVERHTVLTGDFTKNGLQPPSTGGVNTQRRYFGHHTMWYVNENTAPAFLA